MTIPNSFLASEAKLVMRPGMIKIRCGYCREHYWSSDKKVLENYIQICHRCKNHA